MTTISAHIVADSVSPEGIRLTTMELRYPRMIHSEFMTHRVFSRNARSSRAVPIETMLKEVRTDPVIPLHWGAAQKGMQADRECDARIDQSWRDDCAAYMASRQEAWLDARDFAVDQAKAFHAAGYHKQIVNRLLEPFMHIDVLVTATEWANFFALRDHPAAEPHIAMLARAMRGTMDQSTPVKMTPGQWHLPYIWRDDEADLPLATQQLLSIARCARISYKPFDGDASVDAELARAAALIGARPMHASPAEHIATPDRIVRGGEDDEWAAWEHGPEHGNFRGWRQFRKMLPGEVVNG